MLPASRARLFWRAALDPAVLLAIARPPAGCSADLFDLRNLSCACTVLLRPGYREEFLIGHGLNAVRISLEEGSLLAGPVRLTFELSSPTGVDIKLAALRRLLALQTHARWPGLPTDRRSVLIRRSLILRTLDALAIDCSHRAVARELFGQERVEADWERGSDYLRSSVRRLIASARHLAEGGYRSLLVRG